jgi:hypothetical protein
MAPLPLFELNFFLSLALTIGIDLVDHILQLGLGRILSQGPHDGAQLLGGDGAVAVLVKEGEGLLELSDLLLGQLVSLKSKKIKDFRIRQEHGSDGTQDIDDKKASSSDSSR